MVPGNLDHAAHFAFVRLGHLDANIGTAQDRRCLPRLLCLSTVAQCPGLRARVAVLR